jgi:hypothetical protein
VRGRGEPTIQGTTRAGRRATQGGCQQALEHTRVTSPIPEACASRNGLDRPSGASDGVSPAAVQRALRLALQRAAAAYVSPSRWEDRVRAALSALLHLFDERPDIARLCIVQSENAGPAAFALREEALAVLARRIDDGRRHARRQPPEHAAQAVLGGAVGAIRARLLEADQATVRDLLDPLMSFIVLPYRGAAASRGELSRADHEAHSLTA